MVQAINRHHQRAHQCCISPVLSNGESMSDRLAITTVYKYHKRFATGAQMYMRIFLRMLTVLSAY
jgi:hypothetical protein